MREPAGVGELAPLICAQCGAVSGENGRGWRTLPVSDDDELPSREDEIVVFCPECAVREFDSD